MTRRTKIVLGIAAVATLATGVFWAGFFGRSGTNKKRLIGTWTFVSGSGWGKTALTFAEDGKVKTTTRWDRKTYDSEGTYTVKGDTIEMLIVDDSDWGEAAWGNWTTEGDGGKGGKSNTDAKSKPQSQPKQWSEPKPRRVTIRSLTDTELVVADEKGRKTIYARK
jgi:uncharacterized protein (TIGR03066 family)